MSPQSEVIFLMGNIDIGFDLINAAKDEVGGLDISSTTSYKAFPPGEKCAKIIESVKQQCQQKVQARSVIVLLPGTTTEYLQSPCIIIPIQKDGLPITVTTRDGKNVTVDWDAGRAWAVSQDIRLAPVTKSGGTILVLRME